LLSRKRFDATEDRSRNRSAYADQSDTEVMHPINPEGTCPRKPRSSWHCL